MAYVITDGCVSCGTCAGECPVGAISEGDGKYVIDADACLECGQPPSYLSKSHRRSRRTADPASVGMQR